VGALKARGGGGGEEKEKGTEKAGGDGGGGGGGLKIAPVKTNKDKIKQPVAAEEGVIPKLTSNVLMVGCSGSGKTTLLTNLMTRKEFFKGWFDAVYLISPSAKTDDVQKALDIPDENIVDDLSDAPEKIQDLMDEQRNSIEDMGAHRAKQICLIYDDVVGANDELLKTPQFVRSFIASRHFNFTTFLLVQSFTQAPRVSRLQCQNLFYFRGSNSEQELIAEECCAPGLNKREMCLLIDFATIEPYTFLHYTRRVSDASKRYRKNLDEIIDLRSVKTAQRQRIIHQAKSRLKSAKRASGRERGEASNSNN
jgi:GTPase SAR1 family protein